VVAGDVYLDIDMLTRSEMVLARVIAVRRVQW